MKKETIQLNKIYQKDAILLLRMIDNNFIDLVLTDIPYEKVNKKSNGLRNLDKGEANKKTFELRDFLVEIDRVTRGSGYIFCGKEQISEIFDYFNSKNYSVRLMIWEKTNPSPMNSKHVWLSGVESFIYFKKRGATFNEKYKNTVIKMPNGSSKIHLTQKPLKLFEYLIDVSSNKGDIVLDPCVGSGTTAVASKKKARNFIVGDINKKYCQMTEKRIKDYDIQEKLF
ncbi:MAG: Uncharacterized protein Athens071416_87 [Parcubacteria group bacterium Athens0714_16]|nr:MAG: Uncharacterized protein Athens071416_87 [Parcubacteria group bacterium Athens0714_16]